MVDCRECRYWVGNGGIDCNPSETEFFLPCEAFERTAPEGRG